MGATSLSEELVMYQGEMNLPGQGEDAVGWQKRRKRTEREEVARGHESSRLKNTGQCDGGPEDGSQVDH
jgi:hypothetical protein